MTILIGLRQQKAGQGFTLIELLLATVLLMLLIGATVFSYSSLQRGVALEEGVTQFETLLRYSQAQAANTGRRVQLVFEEEVDDGVTMAFGNVRALWEPDPLGQAGQFVELPGAREFVNQVAELVRVESVRPFEPGDPLPISPASTNKTESSALDEMTVSDYQAPIVFYPDGSSDSAEIMLTARDPEDRRRMTVRLVGVTGAIQRRTVADETEPAEETEKPKRAGTVKTVTQPTESAPAPAVSEPQ